VVTFGLFRCSDARFDHSACLLPLLLAKDELLRCNCDLVFVCNSERHCALLDFLATLGMHPNACKMEDVTVMRPNTFYVMHLETAQDGVAYLERFAGMQCGSHLLSFESSILDGEDSPCRDLSKFTAIQSTEDYASELLEALGNKLTLFLHSREMNADMAPAV
jgi:hypothetical protein